MPGERVFFLPPTTGWKSGGKNYGSAVAIVASRTVRFGPLGEERANSCEVIRCGRSVMGGTTRLWLLSALRVYGVLNGKAPSTNLQEKDWESNWGGFITCSRTTPLSQVVLKGGIKIY